MSKQPLTVKPGTKIHLNEFDASHDGGLDRDQAEQETAENVKALDELSYKLHAEDRRGLLIVLQGMDTSGKDGAIRRVMDGISPLCCRVVSFKQPSVEELDHDFLWRIHRETPRKGEIAIFNRSHYEDVLVVRVLNLVPKEVWQPRYEVINTFEQLLTSGGVRIVKLFLHISKDEQRQRLQERLDDPHRHWKFSRGDLEVRKQWDQYQEAYADALTKCNTDAAPWHIVPANKKWYRNYVISRVVRKTLEHMDPQFPPPEPGLEGLKVE